MIKDSQTGERKSPNDTMIRIQTLNPYKTTLLHFKKFQQSKLKTYQLTDINQILVNNFNKYLIASKVDDKKTLSLNAVAKYMQVFKTMVKYAQQLKMISPSLMLEVNIKIRREKSDNIFLDESELTDMLKLELEKTVMYVRDIFLIGCYTGLRYGDLLQLTKEDIHENYISYFDRVQGKTNGRVTIPVHPNVKRIYEKYEYNLPKCPCNQVFNRHLKTIGQMMTSLGQKFNKRTTRSNEKQINQFEKWELLSSHTARRSFCSNLYLRGVDTEVIMSLSGHTTEKSFRAYIGDAIRRKQAQAINKKWFDDEVVEKVA